MKVSSDVKLNIAKDWLKVFPDLRSFTQNKFYKVLGCTVIGIELISLPRSQDYRPYFVVYPLWEKTLETCLDYPWILMEVNNRKGLQFNIPYSSHGSYFDEAVSCVNSQVHLSLEKNQSSSVFSNFIDERLKDFLVMVDPVKQSRLHALKFYMNLFTDNIRDSQEILNQIGKEATNWNLDRFAAMSINFGHWFDDLQHKLNRRQELLKQIEHNLNQPQIQKLVVSQITTA